ncbi:dipeptidyl aminopeptidase/acylaminoacylpeptidase [Mizugakiibacter sediminis]|uniref:Dipeptidyl aminopeptidase/acylaminoacylpeptidase n=1 Tax=Mizugakiibacter sediminis TaxID=1475481 RepID=A0A0K8QJA1_9GAMM|nr:dipeptidyl aminopeptidase/acylaminoacylpeptidase [Mizugakiibacter sediminis]
MLAALALGCAGWMAHAAPVAFADLARHEQYKDVKISPDGEYLAATAVVDGQTVLALIHVADMKAMVVRPRQEDDVIDFWWVSPKRVLYTVGMRWGGYDAPLATGELFAVNADGTGADMLYGFRKTGMSTGSHIQKAVAERGYAEFVAAIPDDPDHALIAVSDWDAAGLEGALPTAYRLDVRDGTKTRIVTAPMRRAEFVADHHGRIRFAYGPDAYGNLKVYLRPLDGGDWQRLTEAGGEGRAYPLAFARDDSVAYFACPAGGGFGVCRWDPAKRALEPVWSNPRVEPDGLLHGLADDSVVGVSFTDGRPGLSVFDRNAADVQALIALMQQFPGESVRFVSGTRDGSRAVVRVEADADPGAFYLLDRKTKKLTELFARAAWIKPEQMAGKQPIEVVARDGLKLQGYLSLPPGKEEAKHLPMVVLVHGGPYGERDGWDYDPDVQALATRGYAVLQVNFRGSGGYGYDFERAGWREWGGKMQDDVTDATRWAIAQGIADPDRICIMGASYGGYAALEGAVKEPDLYRCTIGYVGVYDLRLMYTRGDVPQSFAGENYLMRVLGEDMDELARRSPLYNLDRLKAKVMLIVGGRDRRVPPVQGESLHAKLLERGIAHEWLYQPNEAHGFYDEANVAEMYARVVQFLDSNIGTPAATATR